jgi:hypothetical protein
MPHRSDRIVSPTSQLVDLSQGKGARWSVVESSEEVEEMNGRWKSERKPQLPLILFSLLRVKREENREPT